MNKKILLSGIMALLMCFVCNSCHNKKKSNGSENNMTAQNEVKIAASREIAEWLKAGVEGIQFLHVSNWKMDEKVCLNSSNDRAFLLLLNQDKDPTAELDYIQMLYAVKENGLWTIYLQSIPNLVIPRKKENGKFVVNSLEYLSVIGQKEMDRLCIKRNGEPNDKFINNEDIADLKKKHQKFLSEKIKI